ncbi:kinase-like domain-containing protein [Paraphysoderma sedebokerense]|nr:kinase-like domain-containing protein [Paraphysoderma sedebokerense]
MQTVLSNLGRISNGNTPKVHPWTITSWEIEIGEPIAQGGYGEVCIGTWMGHTKVAVKRLLSRLDTEKSTKEFIKEVEIWHRLKHPYILQLFGACSTADKPFMVCPFMSNGHMLQYLEKHPSEGTRLLYETSQGMQYLHNTNIIHGDLKAVNILVDDSGHAKITDFGFAVVKATHYSKSSSSKVVAGTLRWSAPECLKGDKPSFQSDVYAFGITAFEVGSGGSIPFDHLADAGFREVC